MMFNTGLTTNIQCVRSRLSQWHRQRSLPMAVCNAISTNGTIGKMAGITGRILNAHSVLYTVRVGQYRFPTGVKLNLSIVL